MKVSIISPLEKVFATENKYREIDKVTVFKNERGFFNIHIENDHIPRFFFELEVESQIKDYITIYKANEVPNTFLNMEDNSSDKYLLPCGRGLCPDPLKKINESDFILSRNTNYGFAGEIYCENGLIAGEYDVKIKALHKKELVGEVSFKIEVIDENLPENDLIITEWIHYDSIAHIHNVKPFSEQYLAIMKEYYNLATAYGQTMVMIPLFTYPLDTEPNMERLNFQSVIVIKNGDKYDFDFSVTEKLIDIAFECGFKYIEFSHLFTQWGAEKAPKIIAMVDGQEKRIFGWETDALSQEYRDFLSQFLTALVNFINKKDIKNKCYFHISDEPRQEHLERYVSHAKLIKEHIGDIPVMDALSNYDYYKSGYVNMPVSTIEKAHDFVGKCDDFMVYYCCSEWKDNLSNRFLNMPLSRVRILGYQLYKAQTKGFLHWGFNFYNSALSVFNINPFTTTDAGGFLPSGDPFIVYPDVKNGKANPSIRLFALSAAFDDYRALKLLESKKGKDFVIKFLDDAGVKNFKEYPTEEGFIEDLKIKICRLIKNN